MEQLIELDVMLLNFLLGSVVPLLTALFTKLNASPGVKAAVNLALSLTAGTLGYLVAQEGRTTWYELLTYAIAAYLASGVSYQNLWKPTGVAPTIQLKTRNAGLGRGNRYDAAAA